MRGVELQLRPDGRRRGDDARARSRVSGSGRAHVSGVCVALSSR